MKLSQRQKEYGCVTSVDNRSIMSRKTQYNMTLKIAAAVILVFVGVSPSFGSNVPSNGGMAAFQPLVTLLFITVIILLFRSRKKNTGTTVRVAPKKSTPITQEQFDSGDYCTDCYEPTPHSDYCIHCGSWVYNNVGKHGTAYYVVNKYQEKYQNSNIIKCRFCGEEIFDIARKCRHCILDLTRELTEAENKIIEAAIVDKAKIIARDEKAMKLHRESIRLAQATPIKESLSVIGTGIVHHVTLNDKSITLNIRRVWNAHQDIVIPIKQIASVIIKDHGLTDSFITFAPTGNASYKPPSTVISASVDEYTVLFKPVFFPIAIKIRDYIANYSESTQNDSIQPISSADEIVKFKKLLDDGVLTQDEFNAKKKQLLGL